MNWLLNNPLVHLNSEYLLLFYAVAIVAVILASYRSVRKADRTRHLDLPEIPARLDPYEIAFLRGGETEVTRIALMSLIERGLLRISRSRDWSSTTLAVRTEIERGRKPAPGELAPVEACILKWRGFPATDRQIYQPDDTPFKPISTLFWHGATGRHAFQPGGIPELIGDTCSHYEDNLAAKNLLAPAEMKHVGSWLWWMSSALIVGLGACMLAVALAKGEPLVAVVACGMALIGVIALAPACLYFPRISHRGRAYLDQLELAYDRLRSKGRKRDPSQDSSVYSDRLLLNGIFGEVSRADTPLNDLWNSMVLNGIVLAPGEEPPNL
jgi:uncharacterized protein (TIGR04222 family)